MKLEYEMRCGRGRTSTSMLGIVVVVLIYWLYIKGTGRIRVDEPNAVAGRGAADVKIRGVRDAG
jgi:hypothetical protein